MFSENIINLTDCIIIKMPAFRVDKFSTGRTKCRSPMLKRTWWNSLALFLIVNLWGVLKPYLGLDLIDPQSSLSFDYAFWVWHFVVISESLLGSQMKLKTDHNSHLLDQLACAFTMPSLLALMMGLMVNLVLYLQIIYFIWNLQFSFM